MQGMKIGELCLGCSLIFLLVSITHPGACVVAEISMCVQAPYAKNSFAL
jgi:hypothetical protein